MAIICFMLVACLCQLAVAQQNWGQSSTPASNGSTNLVGSIPAATTEGSLHGGPANSSYSQANLANQAPVTQFFGQMLRGEVYGARKCKKVKDCGLGLRCDLLLNLCVPLSTPILQDIEKPCSNDSECSGMHACQGGLCRFCGPKSCRSSLDCCAGSFAQPGQSGKFYECLNIEDGEKLSIARQLGRVPANFQPIPKSAGGKSLDDAFEVESSELLQLGLPVSDKAFYGKRCWARCNVDNDCYHERTPADVKQAIGCCNNVCTKKSACTVLSPQVIQQAQQLQQQRLQQQQLWAQQQAIANQQQALAGQAHHGRQPQQQSLWGAGGHPQQQQAPRYVQAIQFQQPQPVQPVQYAVPVQVVPAKPVPQSWQEAQQQGPTFAYGQQQPVGGRGY